jgi:Protein of unknown function (DUF3168)
MTLEADMVQWLLAQPAIAARLDDRIFPQAGAPETLRPLLVYRRTGREPFRTFEGSAKPCIVRLQFDCWGGTGATAREIADLMRTTMDGYSGLMGTTTVHMVNLETEIEERDDAWDDYRVTQDWMFLFDEVPIPLTA